MVPDLESKMHKLAETADSSATNRVFVWRQILTEMYQQGFEAGCMAARRDRGVADIIAEKEAKEAPLD